MKIVTWNVNGVSSSWKELQDLIHDDSDIDIVCLQEVKTKSCPAEIPGYVWYWNPASVRSSYAGTGMLVRKTLNTELILMNGVPCCTGEGRDITVRCGDVYIVCVYVPNSGVDRKDPLKRLGFRTNQWDVEFYEMVNKYNKVIVCGDLNVIYRDIDVHNPKSCKNKAGFTLAEQASYARTFAKSFEDSWVVLDGGQGFTFWGTYAGLKESNKGWRLDYQLFKNVTPLTIEIKKEFSSSDHVPLIVTWIL